MKGGGGTPALLFIKIKVRFPLFLTPTGALTLKGTLSYPYPNPATLRGSTNLTSYTINIKNGSKFFYKKCFFLFWVTQDYFLS